MKSIFIFTTNSRVRGERMTDREVIVEFVRGNPTEEEKEASRIAVSYLNKFLIQPKLHFLNSTVFHNP